MPLVKSPLVYCNSGPHFPTAMAVATLARHINDLKAKDSGV